MFKSTLFAAAMVGGLVLGAAESSAAPLGDPSGVAAAATPAVETVQYGYGYYGPRRFYGSRYYGPRRFYGPRYYGPRRFYGPRPFYGPRRFYY